MSLETLVFGLAGGVIIALIGVLLVFWGIMQDLKQINSRLNVTAQAVVIHRVVLDKHEDRLDELTNQEV